MWDQTMKAIDAYNNFKEIPDEYIVQKVINTSDVNMAKKLVKEFNLI